MHVVSRSTGRLDVVLMIAGGGYAVWYRRWEFAVYSGNLASDSIIDTGERLRLWFVATVTRFGAIRPACWLGSSP